MPGLLGDKIMPKLQISSNILLVPNYQMGRGKERLKRQRRKIRSIRNNKIQKIYLDEKLDLHKFAPGKYIANF